jgi:hypothetical protein
MTSWPLHNEGFAQLVTEFRIDLVVVTTLVGVLWVSPASAIGTYSPASRLSISNVAPRGSGEVPPMVPEV